MHHDPEQATETTPLVRKTAETQASQTPRPLNNPNDDGSVSEDGEKQRFRSMQLFSLCCAAITEPVACFCIFPFISEMIQRTGDLVQSDVGFWAGAIESLFSVVQMAFMILYGRMSDRFGRKPVLVFSLTGLSISTMVFGLSRNLWQMIIVRCLAGSFAGSVLTVRIMVAESCSKQNEGKAFAWFMFARNFGILLGPVIGGGFADPRLLGQNGFLNDHPYFLATIATGASCLVGTLLVVAFAQETLVEKKDDSRAEETMSTWELLQQPGVSKALFTFGYTMMLALANTAVLPVFLFTSIDIGGLGFSPQRISYFLAALAASQGLWTLTIFPGLNRRVGNLNIMRLCSSGWPFLFACFPVLNEILRLGTRTTFWAVLVVPLLLGGFVAMSFAGAQLLVNEACPSPKELALINALTQTLNSAVRSVTPALFTSIFAAGVKDQRLHGHLCWGVLILLTLPLNWALARKSKRGPLITQS